MEKQLMVSASYRNHATGETSVTYWRTLADAKNWLRATYAGYQQGEYGIATLSSTESVTLRQLNQAPMGWASVGGLEG